jgi:hypothetical protein
LVQFTGSSKHATSYRHLSRRCHSAVDLGFYAISATFIFHIVRSTAYRYNSVRRHLCYLCVRLFDSSWVVEVMRELPVPMRFSEKELFGFESCMRGNAWEIGETVP